MVKLGEIQPEPESPSIPQWASVLGADRVEEGTLPGDVLFRFQVTMTKERIAGPDGEVGHTAKAEAWLADIEPLSQLEILRNVQGTIGDMIQKMLADQFGQHSIERLGGSFSGS